ncbi:hypothetical protein [Klebsiella oxytoca]|uniref:hypothetical protein n=1 Tax=Klebsiella oxytoca TaxID=571 RepID=UPI001D0ED17F|nr:hypothetical protein [Klebsiella oxytoca]
MTTDITELAQREKFEAWWEREYKHLESSKYTDAVPHIKYGFWMAYQAGGAELVEALEKAQTINAAAEKLVRCKGRYHSEQNYRALAALFGVTIPDLPPLDGKSRTVNAAAANVLAERKRQVSVEGWTPSHDDAHKNNEMAFAAACYAFHAAAASWDLEDCGTEYDSHPAPKNWPWEPEWWKPKSARADLVRAGALILAELERIDRAAGIREAE